MSSTGQGYGEGFFYSPEDQAAQQAIQRRQAYAKALMQDQQHQGQYGGLANAGSAIAGALLAKRADKDASGLATQTQTKYAADLANLLKGGSGASPQVSNAPGSPQAPPPAPAPSQPQLDPEGNPLSSSGGANGPTVGPQGTPGMPQSQPQPQVQPQGQGAPQSMMERIAASGNPALMYQFGPQALQAQMQNDMTRGNKLWENDLPMSRSAREQGAQSLQNQEGLAAFNNKLPMTAEQQAADLRAKQTLGLGYAQLNKPVSVGYGDTLVNPGSGKVVYSGSAAQSPLGADGKPLTGAAYLATLPPGLASTAKAIAEYRQAPLSSMALRSPQGAALMQAVNQINPGYDSTQYGAKNKARLDFATGKNGNTVRSLNVAVQHLDQLGHLSDALGNGNVQAANQIGNFFNTQFGSDQATNFNAAKQIVGDEIVKAIVGAGGGAGDREKAQQSVSAASSPQQLKGVIQTFQGLMAGQLGGLRQQYHQTTGLNDFEDYLAPETRAKLEAHTQGGSTGGGKKTIKFSDLP